MGDWLCLQWKQLRSWIKELIACESADLDGEMCKWALKETGCQERFSNQRGIKRFNLYFTLIQKTCLHGEVAGGWTYQLKWKKLFNCSAWEGTIGKRCKMQAKDSENTYKENKGRTLIYFCFECFFLILEEMILPCIEILGGLSSEHHEVSWKLSKFLLVKMPFACAKWRYLCKYLPFSFIDGAVPTMLKKRC